MFNEKLPDGALSNPTSGTHEDDVVHVVGEQPDPMVTVVEAHELRPDAVYSYSVDVMTSHKGVVTENVEGVNLGPSQAASQALGRVLRADYGKKVEGVTLKYEVISCTETGRLPLV